MYLFFDTETNGFPPKCNMTQLGFILTDINGNTIQQYESIIKPNGWIVKDKQWYLDNGASEEEAIKKGGFFTNNNISTERCEKHGKPIFEVMRMFQEALKKCEYKIAHNINFDNKIINIELLNTEITKELFQFKKGFCTMATTTDWCQLPGRYPGSYKWPKLEELHIKLFGHNFEGAHDALDDVKATVACFFELKKRGIITI